MTLKGDPEWENRLTTASLARDRRRSTAYRQARFGCFIYMELECMQHFGTGFFHLSPCSSSRFIQGCDLCRLLPSFLAEYPAEQTDRTVHVLSPQDGHVSYFYAWFSSHSSPQDLRKCSGHLVSKLQVQRPQAKCLPTCLSNKQGSPVPDVGTKAKGPKWPQSPLSQESRQLGRRLYRCPHRTPVPSLTDEAEFQCHWHSWLDNW